MEERTTAMDLSNKMLSNSNSATTTTPKSSITTTNRRKHSHENDVNNQKPPSPNANNGNTSRKRRKQRICFGCGRVGLFAFMAMSLMLLYGIAMARYIFVFDHKYDVNGKEDSHKHKHHSTTAGLTKEEERNYLQMKQQEKLGKTMQRKKTRNQDYEEHLEKFLKKKKISNFQPKYSKMIHFLHIHKSAGTFVCKQAFQNKLAIDLKRNCNVRDDQKCCWYDQEKKSWTEKVEGNLDETTLIQQSINFAKNAPFDFVATERELAGPMLTDYYDYVVSLRDSLSRYQSHWQHLIRNAKQRKKEVERYQKRQGNAGNASRRTTKQAHRGGGYLVSGQKNGGTDKNGDTKPSPWGLDKTSNVIVGPRSKWAKTGEDPEIDPIHWNLTVINPKDGSIHPVGNFTKWMDGQPDNYSLRMICGTKCLKVPKYGISKELFDYSLEKLWTDFSHILFVEDMDESFARFATSYGWNKLDATTGKKKENQKPKSESSSSMQYNEPFLTVLDDALYEFAKRKYNSNGDDHDSLPDLRPFENQKMVDMYFREGPNRNCTNSCCGYCSKW